MPELGAKGPISPSWGASHDCAANPRRLPEPQILSHCRPWQREPSTLRVTSTSQCGVTDRLWAGGRVGDGMPREQQTP